MSTEQEYVIIWEAPVIEKPEFRLYYDDKGYVLFYTCDKVDGNYIVIDPMTFAEARPDVRVVDGHISKISSGCVITKLIPNKIEGTLCASEDVSILVSAVDNVEKTKWKLNIYEL